MTECNSTMVRIVTFNQYVAVEAAHLGDGKDADAAERTGGHRQNFALGDVGAEVALAVTLQAQRYASSPPLMGIFGLSVLVPLGRATSTLNPLAGSVWQGA